ncbi:MAG: hypothetical protein PHU71_01255 [Candidatus Gracilibacteria bacterium]|nr:hypothetical protein [Candidatus Gracilibacteria bacterium]
MERTPNWTLNTEISEIFKPKIVWGHGTVYRVGGLMGLVPHLFIRNGKSHDKLTHYIQPDIRPRKPELMEVISKDFPELRPKTAICYPSDSIDKIARELAVPIGNNWYELVLKTDSDCCKGVFVVRFRKQESVYVVESLSSAEQARKRNECLTHTNHCIAARRSQYADHFRLSSSSTIESHKEQYSRPSDFTRTVSTLDNIPYRENDSSEIGTIRKHRSQGNSVLLESSLNSNNHAPIKIEVRHHAPPDGRAIKGAVYAKCASKSDTFSGISGGGNRVLPVKEDDDPHSSLARAIIDYELRFGGVTRVLELDALTDALHKISFLSKEVRDSVSRVLRPKIEGIIYPDKGNHARDKIHDFDYLTVTTDWHIGFDGHDLDVKLIETQLGAVVPFEVYKTLYDPLLHELQKRVSSVRESFPDNVCKMDSLGNENWVRK